MGGERCLLGRKRDGSGKGSIATLREGKEWGSFLRGSIGLEEGAILNAGNSNFHK